MFKVLEGGGIKATACRTFGLNSVMYADRASDDTTTTSDRGGSRHAACATERRAPEIVWCWILSREDLTSFFGNAAPKASSVSLCCFAICKADRRIVPTAPDRSRRFQKFKKCFELKAHIAAYFAKTLPWWLLDIG
jgi:hypothetical protein